MTRSHDPLALLFPHMQFMGPVQSKAPKVRIVLMPRQGKRECERRIRQQAAAEQKFEAYALAVERGDE